MAHRLGVEEFFSEGFMYQDSGVSGRDAAGDIEASQRKSIERKISACPAVEPGRPRECLGMLCELLLYFSRFQMRARKKFVDRTQPGSGENMIESDIMRLARAQDKLLKSKFLLADKRERGM